MANEIPRTGAYHPAGTAWNPGADRSFNYTEGVLSRRAMAYLIDIVVVFGIIAVLGLAIFVFGLLTLSLGWWLYMFLIPPLIAIVYNAITIAGPGQGTIGMRMAGLRVIDAATGGSVDMLTAAVHALLFYIAAGTFVLWLVDLGIGFTRPDRRVGHDLLTGIVLVRRG